MRAVVQRVSSASVAISSAITGEIGRGLLVLLGVQGGDTEVDASWLAEKIAALRIFPDHEGKMNLSVREIGLPAPPPASISPLDSPFSKLGGATVLVVSQFTLVASTRKGTRPSFNEAAKPDLAIPLYEFFLRHLATALGRPVASGRFGATMQVSLVNDGPVTLVIDSRLRE